MKSGESRRDALRRRIAALLATGVDPEVARRRLRLRSDYWASLQPLDAVSPTRAAESPGGNAERPHLPHCACQKTGILPDELLGIAQRVAALRPPPRYDIDQVHTTPVDLARRATYILEEGDVDGKDILFVGDDDMCSLALCAAGSPRRVVVVDIDERVLGAIEADARVNGWPVECIAHDLRDYIESGMPPALDAAFDVFVTDPPYSQQGMNLFCAFGMNALRMDPNMVAYVAVPWLTSEEWSDELLFVVERAFLDQGFLLADVRSAFHAYEQHPRPAHVFDDDGVLSTMLRAQSFLRERRPHALVETAPPGSGRLYSSRMLFGGGTDDDDW